MKKENFTIDAGKSQIEWTGRKITGSHVGTIDIKEGILTTTDDQLTGGKFVIDVTSIKILDVTDPGTNAQFAGHLASDDFFSSAQYPEAFLEITAVDGSRVKGNLTIKGITHAIDFDSILSIEDGKLTASAKIVIDRTKYDMKFRSGNFFKSLGDTLIYNDFELNVNITAKAV